MPKVYDMASSLEAELPLTLRRGGLGWSRNGDRIGRAKGAKTNQLATLDVLERSERGGQLAEARASRSKLPVLGVVVTEREFTAGEAVGQDGPAAGRGSAGGGSGPAGPPGGGGGDGQGDPLPPFPQRLPYARCQRRVDEVRCGSDAVFYCTQCSLIWCPEHVCDCTGVLRDMPLPNISEQSVQIYQPCHFPEPPMVFIGASAAYARLFYYFCHVGYLFGTAAVLPLQVVHIEMHQKWISRLVTQQRLLMVSRMAILPEPQFLFWEPKFAFGPA
ncbi:hypothetical protein ZWY2020_045018 [Hordeum vulgare]|nr:hypothetical protein ZWY2020_045018 [Hordeum vulgare]